MSAQTLADIRKRSEERKAANAAGIIGGARSEFDVDFLLRYIDSLAPIVIDTFEQLEEYLQDLNYEHGQDTTALTTREGHLIMTYCTDPDGEWFLEPGDPRERMEEGGDGYFYNRMELGFIQGAGPYTILHKQEWL